MLRRELRQRIADQQLVQRDVDLIHAGMVGYFIGSLSGFALVPTAFNARTIVSVTKFDRKVA